MKPIVAIIKPSKLSSVWAGQDVVTGSLSPGGEARGRPVGVAFDRAGALLIADDAGNTVWRVTSATSPIRLAAR